jgi:hypothetical protein
MMTVLWIYPYHMLFQIWIVLIPEFDIARRSLSSFLQGQNILYPVPLVILLQNQCAKVSLATRSAYLLP